jgi:hypothetical protein
MKKEEMTNEVYYILFFIFIGLLVFLYIYNQQSPQPVQVSQSQQVPPQSPQQVQQVQQTPPNKKTNTNNDTMNYTYNIENIDIHKDNLSNSDNNKLGSASSKYEPELEEVYGTTLRGNEYDPQSPPDEIYNYCIKPNKSDLPIVNPPLQLLLNNAPLRLSERHLM